MIIVSFFDWVYMGEAAEDQIDAASFFDVVASAS
jgi:hypothetical protein